MTHKEEVSKLNFFFFYVAGHAPLPLRRTVHGKLKQLYLSYWSRCFWFAIIFLLKAFDIHIWLFLPRSSEVASLRWLQKSLRTLVTEEKCLICSVVKLETSV